MNQSIEALAELVGATIAARLLPPARQPAASTSLPASAARPVSAPIVVDTAPPPTSSLRSLEYVVVDIETTGGSVLRGHRITEVAAIRVNGAGEVLEEFQTLVNPDRPIPPFVTRLTNITQAMVAGAPRFWEVAPQLSRLLEGRVFVAHNATFDWGFLSYEMEWARQPLCTNRRLCTLRLSRKLVPEVSSRSLDALSYYFNFYNEARHRAYGDARVTTDLLRRLFERLDEREIVCWGDVEKLLNARKARRKRRATPTSMESV